MLAEQSRGKHSKIPLSTYIHLRILSRLLGIIQLGTRLNCGHSYVSPCFNRSCSLQISCGPFLTASSLKGYQTLQTNTGSAPIVSYLNVQMGAIFWNAKSLELEISMSRVSKKHGKSRTRKTSLRQDICTTCLRLRRSRRPYGTQRPQLRKVWTLVTPCQPKSDCPQCSPQFQHNERTWTLGFGAPWRFKAIRTHSLPIQQRKVQTLKHYMRVSVSHLQCGCLQLEIWKCGEPSWTSEERQIRRSPC